jgi:hypothetical protein
MRPGAASRRLGAALAIGLAVALAVVGLAGAKMTSLKIGPRLCETTGGGKFVPIPGFPGERIDRRLLTDVRMLVRRYSIFVTDGYSRSDVHAANGEHPIGLALDIVPNKAAGGRWRDIDRLARWAEPRQNRPNQPFRWVGYDGDANHGRGHHLHLSWSHSEVKPGRTARTVYTARCPAPAPPEVEVEPPAGGTAAGDPPAGPSSGGIGAKPKLAPRVPEADGAGLAAG